MYKMTFIDDFKSKYIKRENGCWEWTARMHKGYGLYYFARGFGQKFDQKHKRKDVSAHRLSYMINVGPIPEGLQINHKCNNSLCVNPDHLYAGTHQDNMRDVVRSRRCYQEKFSPDIINGIKDMLFKDLRQKITMLKGLVQNLV